MWKSQVNEQQGPPDGREGDPERKVHYGAAGHHKIYINY